MNRSSIGGMVVIIVFAGFTFAEENSKVRVIERELLPNQYLQDHLEKQSVPQAMLSDKIPGLSMTFIDKGNVAWQKSYGYADLSELTAVTEDTVFAGASLSKPLTAVTALKYVQRGDLALDADVNGYLRSWKIPDSAFTVKQKVTLRHLIGHRAGIISDVPSPYDKTEKLPTVTQMLNGTPPYSGPRVTLFTAPGEEYRYSNPGYTIIQQLIEDVSGKPFEAAVQTIIFDAINMDSSTFFQPVPEHLLVRRATGYSNSLTPFPYQLFPFKGAGGVWTTPTDLARFAMTLIEDYHHKTGVLVANEFIRQMFARDSQRLGFKKHIMEGSDDIVFDHWGSIPGYTSYMVGSLEKQQVLVIMANSDNGFSTMAAIARTVAKHYGWLPIQPKVFQRYEVKAQQLAQFEGRFGKRSEKIAPHVFEVKEDRLHVTYEEGGPLFPLVAVGDKQFIDSKRNTTFEFLSNRDNVVSWVRVTLESGYNTDQQRQKH